MSQKKFQREKIFKIDIFVLKHVLDHSKSIPTKKNFSKNFRFFGHFLPFLGPKNRFFEFLGGEILKFFSPISKGLYCGHFAPLHASLRLSSTAGSLDLSNFWPKMAKNRGFSKILGRKNFFSKKIFVPSFSTFYCGSFEPSYLYVPLPIEAGSPNELTAPPAAAAETPPFLEVSALPNNAIIRLRRRRF